MLILQLWQAKKIKMQHEMQHKKKKVPKTGTFSMPAAGLELIKR